MSFLDSTGVATLTSDIKAITDATYPANAAIAPPYDSTSAYAVGDFCLKNGLFYKCNTAIASGGEAWTAAHWTLTDTADNLGTKMVILSYGSSTWNDFINAYNKNAIVYCRASSNSNPATGNQTRMAFMAYVNANPPTNVEFQYYRSVNSHSATQQGDQVYVYKLDKSAGWTVTVRENYTKIVAGTGLSSTYSSGTLTLKNTATAPEAATATPIVSGTGAVGTSVKYAREDHVHPAQTTINGHTVASDVPANAGFLPSVSSSDNDKVLKVVSGAWAAVTDDGVPIMVANITQDGTDISSDKTYTQVKAFLDAGGTVFARLNPVELGTPLDDFLWYALLEETPYGITFYAIYVNDAWGGEDFHYARLFVSTGNEWSIEYDSTTIIDESMEAESGGTDLSLVTTGEKYVWNAKYDASNPPPYPVTSVNGSTGAVTIPTLPSVSSSDNGKFLGVDNGAWAAVTVPAVTALTAEQIASAVQAGWV